MKIICISGKAQHGKDTSAQILQNYLTSRGYDAIIVHFADPLKYVCKEYFRWDGKKDDYGRWLLQYIGTDVVREQDPSFWTDFLVKLMTFFKDEWEYVFIPDCRFPSEYEAFRDSGFDTTLLSIHRENFVSPLSEEQQSHPSETAMDEYVPDYTIINDATIEALENKLLALAKLIL